MARPPVMSGEIPAGGAIELLREVELRSITGVLRFESIDVAGEIVLYAGEIAVEQPTPESGEDPVDQLLGVESGTYEVHQRLPPLAVSRGDDYEKRGSLAVHVPADLLNYCELAGLSGVLELTHEGQHAKATYSRGELLAIELDGEDADLSGVFGWEQGRFVVRLDPEAARAQEATLEADPAPEEQPWRAPEKGESTRQFLRVVEMALADVTHESEKARSPSRTSPPLPPPPKARPRPPSVPAPPRRRRDDQTVRLIFLTGDGAEIGPPDRSTRHIGGSRPEIALPEARPGRRATPTPPDETESAAMAKKKRKKKSGSKKAKRAAEPKAPEDASEAGPRAGSADGDPGDPSPGDARAAETDEGPASEGRVNPPRNPSDDADSVVPPKRDVVELRQAPGGALAAFGWAAAVFALGLAILALLAAMPPVSCPPGRESCGWGTGCVEVASDPSHCGGCGQVCAGPNVCRFGECAPPPDM